MKKSTRRKNNRAREKHEVADINKNDQVTRIKLREKASMAESMCTACLFPSKKKNPNSKTRKKQERNIDLEHSKTNTELLL